jgi:hypothetical protein
MAFLTSDYQYLETGDRRFCQAFRLTEDEFLTMAGGLAAYTQHRLDRDEARRVSIAGGPEGRMTFSVPNLPDNLHTAMKGINLPGVDERGVARFLLSEHMKAVRGILDGVKAQGAVRAQVAQQTKDKADSKQRELEALARNNPYGWKPESQSAREWAEAQYDQQQNVRKGG